jgi:hypothetical protein
MRAVKHSPTDSHRRHRPSKPILILTSIEVIAVAATNLYFAQFFYRVNPNKSIESICGVCFLASPAADDKTGLKAWESAHRCISQASQCR